jgi:hypothetical protein
MPATPVASYSFLDAEENCPHKAYHKFVLRDVPFESTPQLEAGNRVHKLMERRIMENQALPEDLEKYEKYAKSVDAMKAQGYGCTAELQLGVKRDGSPCGFFDKDVWLRDKIDVVMGAPPLAFILDWKLVNKPREQPWQLELCALLLKAWRPALTTIKGSFVWLKQDRMGQLHDLSDFSKTWACVVSQMNVIANRPDDYWPKRPNPLCGWCPVGTCEHNRKDK